MFVLTFVDVYHIQIIGRPVQQLYALPLEVSDHFFYTHKKHRKAKKINTPIPIPTGFNRQKYKKNPPTSLLYVFRFGHIGLN